MMTNQPPPPRSLKRELLNDWAQMFGFKRAPKPNYPFTVSWQWNQKSNLWELVIRIPYWMVAKDAPQG